MGACRRPGGLSVYACADPQAPELFTDPSALCLTWERQLRLFRRHRLISMVLIVVWTILQFRSLWESGQPVEVFLKGMWAVWLLAVVCAWSGSAAICGRCGAFSGCAPAGGGDGAGY